MDNKNSGGVGILSVLQIIFIVLKVLNLISWSWWAVFWPTYSGIALWILVLVILFIISILD